MQLKDNRESIRGSEIHLLIDFKIYVGIKEYQQIK